ncbi:MAG: TonB-dependent receptor [Porphyrobacter sp.]|nr:TonB-dependent receptor [Porphyrobacter sp.]
MNSRISLLCSSALAMLAALPAQAQEAPASAPPETESGDIVVTAQFREQRLQDTPLAITAVNAEMLEARSQTDISQVASQAPSVTLKPQGAAFGPSLAANIRGVGQYDFNPALEPGVGLYVDDVYYATLTGSIFDLLDLDRVEILRGPQGTLAGRNSIGGAIKLYSQRPEGSNTGSITAAYGSRDRVDLRGSFDFNITDGLDARIAGVAKRQDGYVQRLDFGCVYPAGGSATLPADAPLNAGQPINPAVGGIPARLPAGSDCVVADEGEVDYMGLRGQVRWRPTDTIDINIIGDYTIDDRWQVGSVLLETYYPNGVLASPHFPLPANPPYNTATNPTRDINPFGPGIAYDTRFVCGPYCNFASYTNEPDTAWPIRDQADGRIKFEGWGVSGQIDWDIADTMQLVSITAYREYTSNFSNDNDTSPMAHSLGYGPLTFEFFSQELRLNGTLGSDEEITYTVGGYYSDQQSVYTSFQGLRGSGLRFVQSDPVDLTSKAVFANASWTPIDPLTINAGIRYTEEDKTYTYSRKNPEGGVAGPPLTALDGLVGEASADHVDYRLALQYRWSDEFMTYAQYATGFKGGGVNPRPFFPQQVLPFGPEKLESFELGFKSDFWDRRVRLNVAGFFSNYNDIQLTLTNCTVQAGAGFGAPCALPVNAGNADVKGVEVETTITPIDGLMIDAAVALVDFDYKEFASFDTPTGPVSVGGPTNINAPQFGDYPAFTPRWKWSLGAQYEIVLGGGAGSITPRIDLAYQGDMHTNPINRDSNLIEGYTLANARLTWRNDKEDLEFALEVSNLFDEYYYLSINDQSTGGQGYTNAQPGRPREWAVSVKKKF